MNSHVNPILVALKIGDELENAVDRAVDQLVNIALVVLSIVLVVVVAKLLVKMLRRAFWKSAKSADLDPAATTLVNNGISVIVYFAAVTLLLAIWGASWSTLLTAISISTLAVVLGLQDLLKSMLGGAFVILDQPYGVGDQIEIEGVEGVVTEVKLRTTVLRTPEGRRVTLPNSVILNSPLTNLDRRVALSTVVNLTNVEGQPDVIKVSIEEILASDPAIAASVTVSEETPHSPLPAILKLLGRNVEDKPNDTEQPVPVLVHVILKSGDDSIQTERETIKRLKAHFPEGQASVRRGERRSK